MPKIYTCPCCGKSYTRRHTLDSYIGDNCFGCSFWLGKADYPDYMINHQVIINGEHFMLGESAGPFQGFGGRTLEIKFFDGRTIETNNLWGRESFQPDSDPCSRTMPCSFLWMPNQSLEVPMFDWLDGLDIEDWMISGPLAKELGDEERERRRLEEDLDQDDDSSSDVA